MCVCHSASAPTLAGSERTRSRHRRRRDVFHKGDCSDKGRVGLNIDCGLNLFGTGTPKKWSMEVELAYPWFAFRCSSNPREHRNIWDSLCYTLLDSLRAPR